MRRSKSPGHAVDPSERPVFLSRVFLFLDEVRLTVPTEERVVMNVEKPETFTEEPVDAEN